MAGEVAIGNGLDRMALLLQAYTGSSDAEAIENMVVDVLFWRGKPINVQLPNYIEAKVVQSDPGTSIIPPSRPVCGRLRSQTVPSRSTRQAIPRRMGFVFFASFFG